MLAKPPPPRIHLPKGWQDCVSVKKYGDRHDTIPRRLSKDTIEEELPRLWASVKHRPRRL